MHHTGCIRITPLPYVSPNVRLFRIHIAELRIQIAEPHIQNSTLRIQTHTPETNTLHALRTQSTDICTHQMFEKQEAHNMSKRHTIALNSEDYLKLSRMAVQDRRSIASMLSVLIHGDVQSRNTSHTSQPQPRQLTQDEEFELALQIPD